MKVMYLGYNVENILDSIIKIILVSIISLISGIIVYSPFFYYGWIKDPTNKSMKSFTKSITIFLPIFILIGSISYSSISYSKFLDILPILATIFAMIPVYYYAWRK